MSTVEDLTARVASLSGIVPDAHTGVSDHMMHGQKVKITWKNGEVYNFYLGTFNVLAPEWVWYQNGRKPDGSPLPGWYSLSGQQGLEKTPLADEANAEKRKTAILKLIVQFFTNLGEHDSGFLCLQEFPLSWIDDLKAMNPFLSICASDREEPWCVCVFVNMKYRNKIETKLSMIVQIEVDEKRFSISCSHLDFNTEANHLEFKTLLGGSHPLFVVGDYNIPCAPLSDLAKNSGSTQTLTEFINQAVPSNQGLQYVIAQNELGYTNFNCRKNCALETNFDHFDNILAIHSGNCLVEFTPVKMPKEGEWWK